MKTENYSLAPSTPESTESTDNKLTLSTKELGDKELGDKELGDKEFGRVWGESLGREFGEEESLGTGKERRDASVEF